MNYLTEIRLFNEWLETNDVTTSGIALWHTLAYLASRNGGESSLFIPLSVIMARTKMSRSSVYRERESLRRHGLIDFDVGDGRQSTGYRIIGFEERVTSRVVSHTETQAGTQTPKSAEPSRVASLTGIQGGTQNDRPSRVESHVVSHTETQAGTQSPKTDEASRVASHTETQRGTQIKPPDGEISDRAVSDSDFEKSDDECRDLSQPETGPYISIYKERDKKDIGGIRGKKKNAGFDLSFIGDEVWEGLVESWLDYKRSRSENYKSDLSVKKFHTMLRNYSRGDPGLARQIIDKSIANNWAGIFELAPDEGKPRSQSSGVAARLVTGQRIGQIKQPEDDERRRKLLEKFDSKK